MDKKPTDKKPTVNTTAKKRLGIKEYFKGVRTEIKKVIWPDRETTRNLTLVVIAVSIVLGILLGGIDYVLFQLFEALP